MALLLLFLREGRAATGRLKFPRTSWSWDFLVACLLPWSPEVVIVSPCLGCRLFQVSYKLKQIFPRQLHFQGAPHSTAPAVGDHRQTPEQT